MSKEFKLPDLGEGIHEGEVLAVKVNVGQQVQEDQIILEVETDKAAVEIPSPYTDVVTQINVTPGQIVHVGDVLLVFGGSESASQRVGESASERKGEKASERVSESGQPRQEGTPVPAAPSTRRLARELGVDLHAVPGSGPAGLVTAEDVRAFAERGPVVEAQPASAQAAPAPVAPRPVEAPPLPAFEQRGGVERVPLRSVRRAIAKQMALSWAHVPHVNTQDKVDITALEALREQYKDAVEAKGGKLTLTVFVVKALANALREFPKFNASLDMDNEEIILKHYYNIGVATDTERGLLVPVLRDADRKSIAEIAAELTQLAQRTREGKAALEDLQGGTMTITNIGALGGTGFAPIINYPEVAILGLAQARLEPVARIKKNGTIKFVPRLMLPVILAFDHRVNDGAEAQRFLNRIMEQLAEPERLLLGL